VIPGQEGPCRPGLGRPPPPTDVGDLALLAKSFERSLLAANRSPATIRIYTISVQQFGAFLARRGMPLVARDERVGLLYVGWDAPHQLDEQERMLLDLWVQHAALALVLAD
jgi:hypothetical protein